MTQEIKTINPDLVPKVKLHTGDEMPIVGLGTFGSDRYSNQEIANAVKAAIRMGYRTSTVQRFTKTKKRLEKLCRR